MSPMDENETNPRPGEWLISQLRDGAGTALLWWARILRIEDTERPRR